MRTKAILVVMTVVLFVSPSVFAGSVLTWGGDDNVANTPAGTDFVDIAAGSYHHCLALKSEDTMTGQTENQVRSQQEIAKISDVNGKKTIFMIPEPYTLSALAIGGLFLRKRGRI